MQRQLPQALSQGLSEVLTEKEPFKETLPLCLGFLQAPKGLAHLRMVWRSKSWEPGLQPLGPSPEGDRAPLGTDPTGHVNANRHLSTLGSSLKFWVPIQSTHLPECRPQCQAHGPQSDHEHVGVTNTCLCDHVSVSVGTLVCVSLCAHVHRWVDG